jgi:hypothetical protein
MISLMSPKRAAPASLIPSSAESAIAQNLSPFVRPSVSAPRQVKLRVNIFWLLSGTAVYSLNVGQTLAEAIACAAAKNLRELGAATGFVFNRASARDGYLNDYSAAYPHRTEARLQSRQQPFST